MQWPFKSWGATTVLTGHDHLYERINVDNFTYFVNGLGGYPQIYDFDSVAIAGSQLRYNNTYGAMLINSYNDSMIFKFYSVGDTLIDNFKILPSIKTLSLTVSIQGFYDPNENSSIGDTVKVYLRNYNSPYAIIDSAKNYMDSSGRSVFVFSKANNGTDYYIVIKHRNSIETWSAIGKKFAANVLNYDFTSSSSQAYGNNMIQVDATPVRYAVYSGDVDQNGFIDGSDGLLVDNDAYNFAGGYLPTDIDGNEFVDGTDVALVDNNAFNFVVKATP